MVSCHLILVVNCVNFSFAMVLHVMKESSEIEGNFGVQVRAVFSISSTSRSFSRGFPWAAPLLPSWLIFSQSEKDTGFTPATNHTGEIRSCDLEVQARHLGAC